MTAHRPLRVAVMVWRLSVSGGIQNVVRHVLHGLAGPDHEAHVVMVRPPLDEDELAEFPHVTFHSQGVPVGGDPRWGGRVPLAARLSRQLAALRPDVVHLQSGTSSYAAPGSLLSGARLKVLDVHDAPASGRHGPVSDWLEGRLCRSGRHVALAHSSSVVADLREQYALPDDRLRLVPLGVGPQHFAAPTLDARAWRRSVGLPEDAVLVTYVARLVESKNVSLFLDVVADVVRHHPDTAVHGVVVGGGAERPALDDQVRASGLADRLHLVGYRPAEDLVNAYHACDVFLSTSDYEGFGLGVVEAMAAGRPVVATAVGGVTDTVAEGETGLLLPRGDRRGLADAVGRLVRDPALRERMGRAGRARAEERFTTRRMVEGYLALYDEARR